MTSGTVASRPDFVHELFLHTSTAELLEFVVAFALDGAAAGEPTLLAVRPETAAAVREAVTPRSQVTILPVIGRPGRPASDLASTDALLAHYAQQAPRVRVLNQEPTVPPTHWHEWRRLEAAVNVALTRHPAWGVCVYDRQTLTDAQIEDLYATHPVVRDNDQDLPNDRYQDPARFAAHRDAPPDLVEQTVPAVDLLDPSPAAARAAVARGAKHSLLPAEEINELVFTTSEAVLNAIRHGRPPVVLRLWTQPERVTVTVTDTGTGPTDPFVGLLPPGHPELRSGEPGLGLWISHQFVDVTHRRHPGGYTIRLTATHARKLEHDRASDPR